MSLTLNRLLPILLAIGTLAASAASPPATSPEEVVRAFNTALSERRLDAALALLAKDAVNFNLETAHGFTSVPGATPPLTSDLAAHWRTVAPVLFATHRRYTREVDAASTQADASLAVVWTRLRTRAEPLRGGPTLLVFAETYVMHREAGGWRIVGMANSRQTR
jgi:ketosteroid isomerase-like protein